MTFGYRIGEVDKQMEEKESIRKYLEMYKSKEYKQTPLIDNLEAICKIIAESNYNGDELRATLLVIYDACIRKEQS